MLDRPDRSRNELLAKLCALVASIAVITLGILAMRSSTVVGAMLIVTGAACAAASQLVRFTRSS